ncbi:MFS quinate transporter, putative [Metarhizium acridum CQMa 102]|uniref:MFS quinate transporter, putative n=1 Tax=Metarhizium acridum (strain CQMa 102) TaxID=655827 RepID=E9EA24_METAQ|nr:MFS quinate transporter, putative [Metarhizium acridum CQMa 102]EFY87274.1 MFS quinate transporter, putative [Metarhizium acridum CQMa 102]
MVFAKILRGIVRNDAMRTDPDQIYNAKVLALVCSACFGGMLFGWDTGAIGGVLAMDQTSERFGYLHRSKTDKSNLDQNIVSTLQAGCFAACLVTFWFADRFGRRWSLIGAGVITVIGVVFQAASAIDGTLAVMYVGRFIAGLGVGAASTLTPLLPADSEYVSGEIQEMVDQLDYERRLMGDATFKSLMKEMWLVPANRRRAVISILLMICQQLTGVNAINYYAPQIFTNLGMNGTDSSLFATGVYGIVKTIAVCLFLLFVADSLGRRKSLLYTSPMLVIVLFIIGIYGRVQPPVTGEPVTAFGYVAMACIYLWAAIFQFGWGPACWILVSEIPSARLRAANVAIGAGTQWLFNFVMARTVLTMQNTMGYKGYGMFFMFGSFDILMGLFVFFFVPETKGLSLEKMDELFGMNETVKQLDAEPETGRPVSVHEDRATKT